MFGIEKYSKPSICFTDTVLKHLPQSPGTFIEVGANNGYSQSNTYYLERFKHWKGILIEPIPELYKECVKERKRSQVFNCALVADNYKEDFIEIYNASLMSIIKSSLSKELEQQHLQKAAGFERDIKLDIIKVPARTLTSVIEESNIKDIDFFSLDVEGYEIEVLKGLDFDKFAPTFILVEANKERELDDLLSGKYNKIEVLDRDVLYKKK
jgi:FkbM family methyltransferase